MATILFSAAGAAIGGSLGGTVLGLSSVVVGRAIGATLGRVIDQRLLGGRGTGVAAEKHEDVAAGDRRKGKAIGTTQRPGVEPRGIFAHGRHDRFARHFTCLSRRR